MLKLWEFLWYGCWHRWEVEIVNDLVDYSGTKIGDSVYYRCAKCGHIKRMDLL